MEKMLMFLALVFALFAVCTRSKAAMLPRSDWGVPSLERKDGTEASEKTRLRCGSRQSAKKLPRQGGRLSGQADTPRKRCQRIEPNGPGRGRLNCAWPPAAATLP
jgi:hypothetical protein